jgi:hypothetical protein
LNSDAAKATGATWWNSTTPTSSVFSLGTASSVNASGGTYVAYLFANNAGGFGLTGNDNVITCGSFTTVSNAATVNLGYEPQWVLTKRTDTGPWEIIDSMRGFTVTANDALLYANTTQAEVATQGLEPTSTGFSCSGYPNATFIYIAIRRGPMKVPTVGTTVFSPIARTGTGSVANVSVGFAPDFLTTFNRPDPGQDKVVFDKLRGPTQYLATNSTSPELDVSTNGLISFNNTSFTTNANGYANNAGSPFVNHVFGRAPGFFDEVCYTGTGSATTQTHNLGAVPELMILKGRSGATDWQVYSSALANTEYLVLNTTAAKATGATRWNSTTPTSSVFSIGTATEVNTSSATYVAYLFATCPGVSKVGSYSGTGATQTIDCGFTGGARFVLIKRTDSTGDWYVWDTARGMIAGTDPSLLLNNDAAEVNANSVYTTGVGFQIVSTAAGINASGGAYIFLAVA